jgi:hypothetical protein
MSIPKKKKRLATPSPRKEPKVEPPAPTVDRYFAGTLPDPQWEPTDKDWELLAEMFKGR